MMQQTEEWKKARLGKVTASRLSDVTAKTKTGYGASRANYMAELLVERLTGESQEMYVNAAMKHGVDTEPQARSAYAFMTDFDVIEVGFIPHPTIEMSGASPDGLIGDDGMLELKCPNTATHIDTLLGEPIADKYIKQMQWQMACSGRKWCDFATYDPRLPANLQIKIIRVNRDDSLIGELEHEVIEFLRELKDKQTKLTNEDMPPYLQEKAA